MKIRTDSWHYWIYQNVMSGDPRGASVCKYIGTLVLSPPVCALALALIIAMSPFLGIIWLCEKTGLDRKIELKLPKWSLRCPFGKIELKYPSDSPR